LTDEREGIPGLGPLLELARRELTESPPRREAASLAVVRNRLALARREHRGRRTELRFTFAAIAMAALVLGFYVSRRDAAPLSMEVLAGELSSIGEVWPSLETTTIRFSDGTRVEVEPAARARVTALRASGADVQLERGQISLDVTKRPGANWNVLAGGYQVHVTGTSFAVAFDQERQTLGVRMFSGSVRVSGPLLAQGVDVLRGERLLVDFARATVQVGPADAVHAAVEPEPEPEQPEMIEPAAPEASARVPALQPSRRSHRAKPRAAAPPPPSWQSLVAGGDFAAVLLAAEQRGLPAVYQTASLDDLDALADAARYARRTSVANDALLAIRSRFAGSSAAKEAAFLIGRLRERAGEPNAAVLEWYERYLQEDGRGVYAAQALGRKMFIVHRQHGPAGAVPLAREYLERFPDGPHASGARKLLMGR